MCEEEALHGDQIDAFVKPSVMAIDFLFVESGSSKKSKLLYIVAYERLLLFFPFCPDASKIEFASNSCTLHLTTTSPA